MSARLAGVRHNLMAQSLLSGGNRRVRDTICRFRQSRGVCMGSALGTCHLKLGAKGPRRTNIPIAHAAFTPACYLPTNIGSWARRIAECHRSLLEHDISSIYGRTTAEYKMRPEHSVQPDVMSLITTLPGAPHIFTQTSGTIRLDSSSRWTV